MIIGRAAKGKMHKEMRLTMNCSGAIGRMVPARTCASICRRSVVAIVGPTASGVIPISVGDELRRALGMMRELAEDVARQIRRPRQVIELDLDYAHDLILEVRLGRHHFDDPREELPRGAPEDRFREPGLAAEVIVQEGLVHPRFRGDVLHPGARGTTAQKDRMRRVEDPLLGVAIGERGRGGAPGDAGVG